MALPFIAIGVGLAGAWAAKKIYDAASSSSSSSYDDYDNSEELEREVQQQEAERRREQRQQRQLQQNSRMIASELEQIGREYLEPTRRPTSFDAATIQAFLDSDFDDRKSLEKALSILYGKPVRMRERDDSCVQPLQAEKQALKQLEQFIREV